MKLMGAGFCCAALLLICGCGKSTETGTNPRPTQKDSSSIAAQSPSTSAAESPAAQELLLRPTPRPPGVSAQFDFVGGAGPGACYGGGYSPQVRVLTSPFPELEPTSDGFNQEEIATYGQPVDVCFDGMGRGPISVTMTGPHGFTMSGVLPQLSARYHYPNGWESFDWVPAIEPSWPLGKYVISARSGPISRSQRLALVAPRGPGLRVLGPSTNPAHNSVPPNSHATLFLTGFKGNSTVKLETYRIGSSPQAQFFSTAQVPIPPSGDTVVEIPTGPDKGPEGSGSIFIITARSNGRILFAPFTVFKEQPWDSVIVGVLPKA